MYGSGEFKRPSSDDQFELMCHQLFRAIWNDDGCTLHGSSGQRQDGIDILGIGPSGRTAVQCKFFDKTQFTLKTVRDDVVRVDGSNLELRHLIFATTAPSDPKVSALVAALSDKRSADGKFTVSVHFWRDLCSHLQMHPHVGRSFLPDFPGSTLERIGEDVAELLRRSDAPAQRLNLAISNDATEHVAHAGGLSVSVTGASGAELDPRAALVLDIVRDEINAGRTVDALQNLTRLGDPANLRDLYSRYRWLTNRGAIFLLDGNGDDAAAFFLQAFDVWPEEPKSHANLVLAYLITHNGPKALAVAEVGLAKFPDNELLCARKLAALKAIGLADADKEFPSSVRDGAEMLFARGIIRGEAGDHAGASELFQRCLSVDGGSLGAKRSFLSEVLQWIATDGAAARFGQIPAKRRGLLDEAVAQWSPVEDSVANVQSPFLALELANNLAVALTLLGQIELARTIATTGLRKHPLSEGLLQIRINELNEANRLDDVHILVDSRISELPESVLLLLAEIAANRGESAWLEQLLSTLSMRSMDPQRLSRARLLRFHSQSVAGDTQGAIDGLAVVLQGEERCSMAEVMYGQYLGRMERVDDANLQADKCLGQLGDTADPIHRWQLADFLYSLSRFREAASLYEHLIVAPGDDQLTRDYLTCLVRSDQRQRARDVLDAIPTDARAASNVRHIELALAHRSGDTRRERMLLDAELRSSPNDAAASVAYASVLDRDGDHSALQALAKRNPVLTRSRPELEIEFAKAQRIAGFGREALERMTRAFMSSPSDPVVAGLFVMQVLSHSELFKGTERDIVTVDTAVRLMRHDASWWVVIDGYEETKSLRSWPECVSNESTVAIPLLGRKVGDEIRLHHAGAFVDARIVELQSLAFFAFQRAQEVIRTNVTPGAPVTAMMLLDENGEPDIDAVLQMVSSRNRFAQQAFEIYKNRQIPLSFLAKTLGTDVMRLMYEWPSDLVEMFVGFGSREEQTFAAKTISDTNNTFVLDLVTLTELALLNALEPVCTALRRPFVSRSTREHVHAARQVHTNLRRTAIANEVDGKLQVHEISPEHEAHAQKVLRRIVDGIDSFCEVVPVIGPAWLSDSVATLIRLADAPTRDTLLLCIERNAVLVSDDGALRTQFAAAGYAAAIALQPALHHACTSENLTPVRYAELLIQKTRARHNFVSFHANDLVALAMASRQRISANLLTGLEYMRRPDIDLPSAVQAIQVFLGQISKNLPVEIVAEYSRVSFVALIANYPQFEEAVHRSLYEVLSKLYGRGGRKLPTKIRSQFGSVLSRPMNQNTE